jgi:selenocysteine lyase/cysteine desulfurase
MMTPGGFKAFEHVWSMTEAFQFHQRIGKAEVSARTPELAARVKAGLLRMPHGALRTPPDPTLSAGIVSFDIPGLSADAVVERLRDFGIIASASPYAQRHARLTPSIRNTLEDVDHALASLDHVRPRRRQS